MLTLGEQLEEEDEASTPEVAAASDHEDIAGPSQPDEVSSMMGAMTGTLSGGEMTLIMTAMGGGGCPGRPPGRGDGRGDGGRPKPAW